MERNALRVTGARALLVSLARRALPFLAWLPGVDRGMLRADLVAGITVALVLVPQSMAYAQLAGLPPHYGLYTAFLPVIVGALWGSSAQLASGPVAVVSLLTGAALAPLAVAGSDDYVRLAIMLAFLVGAIQLAFGVLRLGFVVNFLSLPVIAGFTSAAAIIIALSQLDKLLGLAPARSGSLARDVVSLLAGLPQAHWPTLVLGVGALAAMLAFRRFLPSWPGVMIVVAATTTISWASGFERTETARPAQIADPDAAALVEEVLEGRRRLAALAATRAAATAARVPEGVAPQERSRQDAARRHQLEILELEIGLLKADGEARLAALRRLAFERFDGPDGEPRFRSYAAPPAAAQGSPWRIRTVGESGIRLSGGGEVVGHVPAGLPPIGLPALDMGTLAALLAAAFTIAMVGFMEAISIAKAVAVRTRQRLDPDQELLGQGLSNLAGCVSQCYPASGSFSRTALNAQTGARTALSSVITALVVVLVLAAFTPLLYHLPQAVLAAVIMLAVASLVHFGQIAHAWRVNRHDGMAGAATFVAALALAPHLDFAILFGAGLSVLLYLYRSMRPRVRLLAPESDAVALSFEGDLYFANVPFFEETVLEARRGNPRARHVLIVADGMNQVDASGEQAIRQLHERLRENGVAIAFCGLKPAVREVLEATGLAASIGKENFFASLDEALAALEAARAEGAGSRGEAGA